MFYMYKNQPIWLYIMCMIYERLNNININVYYTTIIYDFIKTILFFMEIVHFYICL